METAIIDEARAYRRALGCFATGVALITTPAPDGVAAITINSFASVSLNPRIVLWSLDDRSERYGLFSQAETWAVNVLGPDQEALSARFATQSTLLIDPEEIERDAFATPLLRRALARFSCRTLERRTVGDHLVLFGQVQGFDAAPGDGLTYFRGRYGLAPSPAG